MVFEDGALEIQVRKEQAKGIERVREFQGNSLAGRVVN
jgi:hypothetical protein